MTLEVPRIRVVIVTWNGLDFLPECLDSVLHQTIDRKLYEVVVVDNASTDGTGDYLAGRDELIVKTAPRNLGFAGGAYLGMAGFRGDYVALVNNDATLAPDCMAAWLAAMDNPANRAVGALTSKILLRGRFWGPLRAGADTPSGSFTNRLGTFCPAPPENESQSSVRLVNSTGNIVDRRGHGRDRDWLSILGDESHDPDVFGFCGAGAVLRRSAIDEVGGFDPRLFLYYEDTDLSWRLRAGGWTIRYEETALVDHRHAATSDATSATFRFYNTRNSLIVFTRHAPWRYVIGAWLRTLAGAAKHAIDRRSDRAVERARRRAIQAALRCLPTTLRDRRRMWRDSGTVMRSRVGRLLE